MKKIYLLLCLLSSTSLTLSTQQEIIQELSEEEQEDQEIRESAGKILTSMALLLINPHNPVHAFTCVTGMAKGMFDIFSKINRKRGFSSGIEVTEEEIMNYLKTPEGEKLLERLQEILHTQHNCSLQKEMAI